MIIVDNSYLFLNWAAIILELSDLTKMLGFGMTLSFRLSFEVLQYLVIFLQYFGICQIVRRI